MPQPYSEDIQCRNGIGRDAITTVTLDITTGDLCLITPPPAGRYNLDELQRLIAALEFGRGLMTGRR